MLRRAFTAVVATVMVLTGVVVGTVTPMPAGAAPAPLDLEMVEGELLLRDADEPTPLEQPTTIDGTLDDATGLMTDGAFSTPTVSTQFPIEDPIEETVYVDATFTEVDPGTVAATVDDNDNLTVDMVLTADLHIEVGSPAIIQGDCTATPVPLQFTSAAPYDREGTKQVTLADADFTVPEVTVVPGECGELIAGGVNDRLAGGGHSLELVMQGEVPPLAEEQGEATTTTLSVAPAVSRSGDEVTLTADVAPNAGGPEVPTGSVEFSDGDTRIGISPLDETGRATLVTTDLTVGEHQLTARYPGDGELFQGSQSAPVAHLVAAAPEVSIAMDDTVLYGGLPRSAEVTVTNPELGGDITNARLDVSLAAVGGQSAFFDAEQLRLEWRNGETWQPVPLTFDFGQLAAVGSVGPATGFLVDAGTDQIVRLRLAIPEPSDTQLTSCGASNPPCFGPYDLSFSLLEVDPGDGAVVDDLAQAEHRFTLVESTRQPTTLEFPLGGPFPNTVRQGFTAEMIARPVPALEGSRVTGSFEVLLDGRVIPTRTIGDPFEQGYTTPHPFAGGTIQAQFLVPPEAAAGPHIITVRYMGDQVYAPSEASAVLHVLPSTGDPFVCRAPGTTAQQEYGANVTFDATISDLALPGETLELDLGTTEYVMNRPNISDPWLSLIPPGTTVSVEDPTLDSIQFDLGPEGSGSAQSVTRTGATPLPPSPGPADPSEVDQHIAFGSSAASVMVDGEPGDNVPVTLDEIVINTRYASPPLPAPHTCTPAGDPMVLGEVELAGTTVSVDPGGPVRRTTDEVTISAETFPSTAAGTAIFTSDIDGELGTEEVTDGSASLHTSTLSPGVHQITASFEATDPAVPDSTSDPVELEVLPEFDCPDAAEDGSAAVVRLTYLELLGRCPDAAGLAFWASQLDDGVSPETFARSIAYTNEALGQVVDDGYRTILERDADPAGRAFWIQRLSEDGRYDQLLADLAASGEFWSTAGSTNAGFVDQVYERLLNRSPDADGRAYWVDRLDAGESRRVMVRTFARLGEPLGEIVEASFDEILDRAPASWERTEAVDQLRTDGDRSGLYAQLIGTGEFFARSQQYPNPEA